VIGPPRALARVPLVLLLASSIVCCGLLGAGVAPALAAEGTAGYVHESEADFARQLAAKEVRSVTINKRLRTMRVTLSDGSRFLARYPKKQEPQTVARLQARGVKVRVLSKDEAEEEAKPKSSHHKIRYIVGAVLIAAIVIVGGVLLYHRRRSRD
jgi:ATP-dependent Zn protease